MYVNKVKKKPKKNNQKNPNHKQHNVRQLFLSTSTSNCMIAHTLGGHDAQFLDEFGSFRGIARTNRTFKIQRTLSSTKPVQSQKITVHISNNDYGSSNSVGICVVAYLPNRSRKHRGQ